MTWLLLHVSDFRNSIVNIYSHSYPLHIDVSKIHVSGLTSILISKHLWLPEVHLYTAVLMRHFKKRPPQSRTYPLLVPAAQTCSSPFYSLLSFSHVLTQNDNSPTLKCLSNPPYLCFPTSTDLSHTITTCLNS